MLSRTAWTVFQGLLAYFLVMGTSMRAAKLQSQNLHSYGIKMARPLTVIKPLMVAHITVVATNWRLMSPLEEGEGS